MSLAPLSSSATVPAPEVREVTTLPRTLAPADVLLCLLRTEVVEGTAFRSRCLALLNPSEEERRQRFVFERNRNEFLLGRALTRLLLSHVVPTVRPEAWSFRDGSHGRPEIAGPAAGVEREPWSFNVSHTEGLVVVALSRRTVGVDVESRERRSQTVAIADRFFSRREVAELRALPDAEQRRRFFVLWTLKEAYIKARGLGLAIPLGDFGFSFPGDTALALSIEPSLGDRPERWAFVSAEATPHHQLGLCVEHTASPGVVHLLRTWPG